MQSGWSQIRSIPVTSLPRRPRPDGDERTEPDTSAPGHARAERAANPGRCARLPRRADRRLRGCSHPARGPRRGRSRRGRPEQLAARRRQDLDGAEARLRRLLPADLQRAGRPGRRPVARGDELELDQEDPRPRHGRTSAPASASGSSAPGGCSAATGCPPRRPASSRSPPATPPTPTTATRTASGPTPCRSRCPRSRRSPPHRRASAARSGSAPSVSRSTAPSTPSAATPRRTSSRTPAAGTRR